MAKITSGHSGPLNMRATFTLNGVHRGDASILVDLMRSDETIDRQTREAIANALERTKGIRLEFHRGNDAPFTAHAETQLRYQEIADRVFELMALPGAVEKNVKADVAKEFAVSPRTVETALERRRRNPNFRISKSGGRSGT